CVTLSDFEVRCFWVEFGHATDTIAAPNFIKDSETIISNDGEFLLGFFSPVNSTYRYVGIWYAKVSTTRAIWVANRNKPLKTTSGILTISKDGNIVVLDGEKNIIWSSNVTGSVPNRSVQLLDSGNLVLQENTTASIIWESFQHPSDSFLPTMKISANIITGEKVQLTSWKSHSPYWRSGPWNSQIFIGIPHMPSRYLDGFNLRVDDKQGSFSLSFVFSNKSLLKHYVLSAEGNLLDTYSSNGKDWSIEWSSLTSECDVYGKCGAFGSCNLNNSPICSCLKGFEPKNREEWNRENWTSGCVRRTPLQCMRASTGTGEDGKKDGFLKAKMMKTPSLANWSSNFEDECRYRCLENCSCLAYAYGSGFGCLSWSREYLIDSQQFSSGGVDLYVRVASSELDRMKDVKVIVIVTVVIGTAILAMCTFFFCRRMAKRKASKKKSKKNIMGGTYPIFHREENLAGNINQDKLQDQLPIFSLEELASATNSFDQSNKLGQDGFGPVYRGKLLDGQEIAVKRLARTSGQGMQEFMNEVTVISKLQHRNLVRLLGGCIEGEEKPLVYEYMPNKSLDAFLFG
ncbi:hypothetical protein I3760_10G113200, partial [Carya illinoinensis]